MRYLTKVALRNILEGLQENVDYRIFNGRKVLKIHGADHICNQLGLHMRTEQDGKYHRAIVESFEGETQSIGIGSTPENARIAAVLEIYAIRNYADFRQEEREVFALHCLYKEDEARRNKRLANI